MAKSVNKVLLLGNIGKDPEVLVLPSGTTKVNLSLATSDRIKGKGGEWHDRAEWHNLAAFGRTAEIIRDYVRKGSKLFIEGSIHTRSWDDEESQQRKYRTEVVVSSLSLLSAPTDDNGQRHPSSLETHQPEQFGDEITDADLPF